MRQLTYDTYMAGNTILLEKWSVDRIDNGSLIKKNVKFQIDFDRTLCVYLVGHSIKGYVLINIKVMDDSSNGYGTTETTFLLR